MIRNGIIDLTVPRKRRDAPPSPPGETIRVFTDGSCRNNGRRGATAGIGVHFPEGQAVDVSQPYYGRRTSHAHAGVGPSGRITNQRAELEAILVALEAVESLGRYQSRRDTIEVYTDSEYCISCLTNWVYGWRDNGWKTRNGKNVKNRDLIESIWNHIRRVLPRVVFYHIPAHTGNQDEHSILNARVDQLATQAADASQVQR